MCYSPQGRKEWDTTESTHTHSLFSTGTVSVLGVKFQLLWTTGFLSILKAVLPVRIYVPECLQGHT